MASLGARLGAAAISAGLAAAVLLLVLRGRERGVAPVELRLGPTPFEAGAADDAGEASEAARHAGGAPPRSREEGPGVLELEHPRFPPSAFVREPWREERFGAVNQSTMPDPFVQFRYRAGVVRHTPWPEHPDGEWILRTNALGMREDQEVSERRPDLRVLVAGDSHTDGVCNNDESFANLLEAHLRRERPGQSIEVLNAGRGGYGFYQYLGTLERFLDLRPDVLVVAVYGGNDFDEVLTPFHQFNGTVRPPGSELYREAMKVIMKREELQPPIAQGLAACKYFDLHPDEMETALQAARDVTTEILVTCLRHGVHPVFVYLPTLAGTEWASDAEVLDELTALLGVSPAGLASVDRLADSYLEFLRGLRVDVLDLRETFARAGPGNYWVRDHHLGLRGHALAAEALYPLVDAAVPAGSRRARTAPVAAGPAAPTVLLSPGSALEGELAELEADTSRFADRAGFDEAAALELFGRPPGTVFDPAAGLRYAPDLRLDSTELGLATAFPFVTNGAGLRMDAELLPAPDLRVVIAGDEQTAGACENGSTLAGVLERELRELHPGRAIEVVNAAVAGHGFHSYLGVLERSRELAPDVLVVAVSSGSDFDQVLRVDDQLSARERVRREDEDQAVAQARARAPAALARSLESIAYFLAHRQRAGRAFELARDATLELARRCEQDGIELIVVHVPDPLAVEWKRHAARLDGVRDALAIEVRQLDTNARIAESWLNDLERRNLPLVRLETAFGAARRPLYLPGDLLMNADAHRIAAEQLLERIERLASR